MYGAVNTNKQSGTSAPVLRADMASHCWQLSFVRRGEACWAAGRTARGSVFLSTEECLFWYSRRATVSCVSRRVCTNSPAWCTTRQPNDQSRRATERRCRSSTPRLNGGSLYSWCCRVDGAKDEPKRGSVLHPDGGPAGPVRPCWAWRRLFRSENKHRQGGRYEPAPARFRISVDVYLMQQICVTFVGCCFFLPPPKFKTKKTWLQWQEHVTAAPRMTICPMWSGTGGVSQGP